MGSVTATNNPHDPTIAAGRANEIHRNIVAPIFAIPFRNIKDICGMKNRWNMCNINIQHWWQILSQISIRYQWNFLGKVAEQRFDIWWLHNLVSNCSSLTQGLPIVTKTSFYVDRIWNVQNIHHEGNLNVNCPSKFSILPEKRITSR